MRIGNTLRLGRNAELPGMRWEEEASSITLAIRSPDLVVEGCRWRRPEIRFQRNGRYTAPTRTCGAGDKREMGPRQFCFLSSSFPRENKKGTQDMAALSACICNFRRVRWQEALAWRVTEMDCAPLWPCVSKCFNGGKRRLVPSDFFVFLVCHHLISFLGFLSYLYKKTISRSLAQNKFEINHDFRSFSVKITYWHWDNVSSGMRCIWRYCL